MCGIVGYFGQGDWEILKKMAGSLIHRGPDDYGFYCENDLGLWHQRLSIIDLKTGHQPIFNEDKTVVIIFNGEIYNFQDLRKKLINNGHRFYTKTDTETIVHLYEEKKENFLEELNGMFALALWDEKQQKIILARDRLGQKPLYYSFINNTLIFGSEIKALLEYPYIKKELDYESLVKYLIYEYVPTPHCILKNIYKLGPAEYLIFQNHKLHTKKYWDISFNKFYEKDYFLEELDKKFRESVKKRLISDMPLGIFLSGGIDSSSIAYYAQKDSLQKIKTFSIGFEDESFDESKYARQVADFIGSEHYEQILSSNNCLELIPQIADFLDEPLGDASIIPTYLLSKFTREKVTVALSGDGGDELLMGYPTFQAHKLYRLAPNIFNNKIINFIINHLPVSLNNISLDFKLKQFISGFKYKSEIQDQIWMGSFCPKQLEELLTPQIYQEIKLNNHFEEIDSYLKIIKKESLENRLIYLYLKNYLQDDILVKTDRASMVNSLEVRAPFLDYNLVDFINSMPNEYKLRGWQTKYIFKKLMKDKLPKNIVYRSKKGFGIPIAKWIKNDLKDFVLDIFSESKIKKQGIFNYNYINVLLKDHFFGQKDNRKFLWSLLIFEIWRERWL